eukprot:CAMPEP_0174240094 /NCGR_PEP_ID=MMETSP0417-20130205/17412_1 /TAXON_ID=242541 /ORGANISM="Mayorella sp, Strain BSH-02190019" /LENGTH=512 /DNA_ID=CAMNT_0015319125 /DNA_START=87 /DNA_END=1622 /DNA_ORIENTATION=-
MSLVDPTWMNTSHPALIKEYERIGLLDPRTATLAPMSPTPPRIVQPPPQRFHLIGPCMGPPNAAVALVTVLAGVPHSWTSRLRANRLYYCQRHQYAYCELPIIDYTRSPHWSKLLAVFSLLSSFERVLWMDEDMLIGANTTSLPEMLVSEGLLSASLYDTVDLIAQQDKSGRLLNAGFVVFRSSNWTRSLLRDAYALAETPTFRWLKFHTYWEQAALRQTLLSMMHPHESMFGHRFFIWPLIRLNLITANQELPSTWSSELPILHMTGKSTKHIHLAKAEQLINYGDQIIAPSRYTKKQTDVNHLLMVTQFSAAAGRIGPCFGHATATEVLLYLRPSSSVDQSIRSSLEQYALQHKCAVCDYEPIDSTRSWRENVWEIAAFLTPYYERVYWFEDVRSLLVTSSPLEPFLCAQLGDSCATTMIRAELDVCHDTLRAISDAFLEDASTGYAFDKQTRPTMVEPSSVENTHFLRLDGARRSEQRSLLLRLLFTSEILDEAEHQHSRVGHGLYCGG